MTARKTAGRTSASSRSRSSGRKNATAEFAGAAPGGVRPIAPVLTPEQQEQAERDKKGITRPGFERRDLREGVNYGGVFYSAGEKREIPVGLANHLDTMRINPDASIEAGRASFGGKGKEDDQEAQGKAIASAREGSVSARRKHRDRPEFAPIAGAPKAKK